MAKKCFDDFQSFVPTAVSYLLHSLESRVEEGMFAPDFLERLNLVLASMRRLKPVLGDYLQLLIPALVKLTDTLVTDNSAAKTTDQKKIALEKKEQTEKTTVDVVKTIGFLLWNGEASIRDNSMAAGSYGIMAGSGGFSNNAKEVKCTRVAKR